MQLTPKEVSGLTKILEGVRDFHPGSFSFTFTRQATSVQAPTTVEGQIDYVEEEDDGTIRRVPVLSLTEITTSKVFIDLRATPAVSAKAFRS
jgi:hypothetical protein